MCPSALPPALQGWQVVCWQLTELRLLPPACQRLQLLAEVQGAQVQTKEGHLAAQPAGSELLLLRCGLAHGSKPPAEPALASVQLHISSPEVRAATRLMLLDNTTNEVSGLHRSLWRFQLAAMIRHRE